LGQVTGLLHAKPLPPSREEEDTFVAVRIFGVSTHGENKFGGTGDSFLLLFLVLIENITLDGSPIYVVGLLEREEIRV
jgi:hypothetical protein